MKFKHCYEISKETCKNNRNLKKIILSLTLSIFCLIPILYSSIMFNFFVNSKLEKQTYSLNTCIVNNNHGYSFNSKYRSDYIFDKESFKNIINKVKYQEKVTSTYIQIPSGVKFIKINNNYEKLNNNPYTMMKFINLKESTNAYLSNKDFNTIKLGKGFYDDGYQQIMVSEKWLENNSINSEDIINRHISLKVDSRKFFSINTDWFGSYGYIDNDNDPENVAPNENSNSMEEYDHPKFDGGEISVFKDYEVVGIINKEYYKNNDDAPFWFSDKSLNNGETYLPIVTSRKVYNENGKQVKAGILTYKSINYNKLSIEATNKGLIFPFLNNYGYHSKWDKEFTDDNRMISFEPVTTTELKLSNSKELFKFNKLIKQQFKYYIPNKFTDKFLHKVYDVNTYNYLNLKNKFDKFTIFFKITGSLIFVTAMFNLFAFFNYNARSKSEFFSLMQALGTDKSINLKIYICDILYIVKKIFFKVFIINVLIIGLINFIVKKTVKNINISLINQISAFLLSHVILLGTLYIVSILYVLIINRQYFSKNFLKVLNG